MTASGEDSPTGPEPDCGGQRRGTVASPGRVANAARPGGLWALLVLAVALSVLVAGGAGCSSKPAAKKRGSAATRKKKEAAGLAELAGETGKGESESVSGTPTADGESTGAEAPSAADGGESASTAAPQAEATAPAGPSSSPAAADPMPTEAAPAEDAAPNPPAPALADLAPAPRGDAPRPLSPLVDPDTALPLDGGRIEVCSPVGWTRSPRSANYLVRFQPGPRKTFPSIVVTAEPAPEGLESVSATNQAKLVSVIAARLAEIIPDGGPVKLIKKPAAATFGPHAGVAWALPGTAKVGGLSEPIERFAYGVVLGGRLYTVETRAPKGKLDDDAKAAAKAVAATLFRPAGAPTGQPEAAAPAAPAGAEAETGN